MNRVQILDEIVGPTEHFSLGKATSIGEGKPLFSKSGCVRLASLLHINLFAMKPHHLNRLATRVQILDETVLQFMYR